MKKIFFMLLLIFPLSSCQLNQKPAAVATDKNSQIPVVLSACQPNYVFSSGRILSYASSTDIELRLKYQQGKCLDGSWSEEMVIRPRPINKNCSVCQMQEIIYYCRGDNQYIVERGQSEGGVYYYLFRGKPCK